MKVKYCQLLIVLLFYPVESAVVEVLWTYHNSTAFIANGSMGGGIYRVVSDSEMAIIDNGTLSLRNDDGVFAEAQLPVDHQADELYAYKTVRTLHIVASTRAPSRNHVTYCKYFYRNQRLFCPTHFSHLGPQFAVAIRATDPFSVNVVYEEGGDLVLYNLVYGYEIDRFPFLESCTCTNSNCLNSVAELKGRVMLQCNGSSHLYDVEREELLTLPLGTELVATSDYQDLIMAVSSDKTLNQDIMVQTNFATNQAQATSLPFKGAPANESNPVKIHHTAVVVVNETIQLEVCYYFRNNEILYFKPVELKNLKPDELRTYPDINYLPLPPDIVSIAYRGRYDSVIVVEVTFGNGSSVLLAIEARIPQDEGINSNGTNATDDTTHPSSISPTSPVCTESPSSHVTTTTPMPTKSLDDSDNPARTSDDDQSNNSDLYKFFILGFIACLIPSIIISILLVIFACRCRRSSGYNPSHEEKN